MSESIRATMPLQLLSEAVEIEAAEDSRNDDVVLPRFSMVAYTGGAMRVAGWRYPVVVDLAGLVIPSQTRPVRFGHDIAAGVGHTDSIRVADGQLLAAGVISRDTPAAQEVVASARKGFPWQASISATVEEFEFVKANQTVLVNGRQFAGPVYVVRKATLGEISFVDLGADAATTVSVAAANNGGNVTMPEHDNDTMKVDQPTSGALQSQSESQSVSSESVSASSESIGKSSESGGASSESGASSATPTLRLAAQSASSAENPAAEAERVLAIRKVCAGRHPDIEARAIKEGWSVNQCALEVVRADRPKAPAVHAQDNGQLTEQVLEAALRLGVHDEKAEKDYPDQVLEAAYPLRRMGFRELALMCCRMEGVEISPHATDREMVRAAFSTRSLPNVLKNTANKVLLAGYQAVDLGSLRVSKILTANDFKEHTAVRLTGEYRFTPVANDGELKYAKVGDQGYPFRVQTYGRLIGLTRQDLINDDLGAFTELPYQIGRGAALALEQAFWQMVEAANGTFFSTANKNTISGASSAFGIDGLNAAIAKLRKQTDDDGNPIKVRPRFVAVPPDLEADATQIYTSNVLLVAGSADRTIAANNPHANKYEPVVSEYLTGNGAASVWYLVGDPLDVPAFGVAFLRGQDQPVIEEADPDPRYLGTLWRGYWDFGVCLLDPRGAIRAAGS